MNGVLQLVGGGSANKNEIKSDLNKSLVILGQIDTYLLPEAAAHDIAVALGWVHEALGATTLPGVESSTAQAAKELRYTEQVM